MKIEYTDKYPINGVRWFEDDELDKKLAAVGADTVAEIFKTPLVGAYNWDYTKSDNRINRLYELGKQLNWNATTDIDWNTPRVPRDQFLIREDRIQYRGLPHYDALSEKEKIEFTWHLQAQNLSNIIHGEQGAMLVASQLASCAPTYNAKLYASSQTFDEARHVEVFLSYLRNRIGFMYPIQSGLKLLLDKVLSDSRWDLKFIGMQIIIEGLALAAFHAAERNTNDPLLAQIMHYVIRDEARHVTFGVNYLEEFVQTLPQNEREERAEFALEACIVMRDRLVPTDALKRFGFDVESAVAHASQSDATSHFRTLLFSRVMPNLKRIGLLTDSVMERYEKLGLSEMMDMPDDLALMSWDELSKSYRDSMDALDDERSSRGMPSQKSAS